MIKKILDTFLLSSKICGIEITTINSDFAIHAIILKKQKQDVVIEKSFTAERLTELPKFIDKTPVSLNINNNHVITKQIESEQLEFNKLVQQAFPNINPKDFYIEIYKTKQCQWISICRKDYIENLLKDFEKIKIEITTIHIGFGVLSAIVPFLSEQSICTSNYSYILNHKEITDVQKENIIAPISYHINGLDTISTYLISFSIALNHFLNSNKSELNFNDKNNYLLTHYKQKKIFKKGISAALIFFLVLLSTNALFFSFYHSKLTLLEQNQQHFQASKTQLNTWYQKIEDQENMVKLLLKTSQSKSSFYIDDITKDIPNTIILNQLNYQPLLKRIKPTEPIKLQLNTIVISGASTDSNILSLWLSNLEHKDWCQSAKISHYASLSKSTSEFEIKINLYHDY